MQRLTVIVILLFLSAVLYGADHDRDISFLYSGEAVRLYREDNYDFADSCARSALEFEERNSDALFVRGMVIYTLENAPLDAAELITEALSVDTWSLVTAGEAKKTAFLFFMEARFFERAVDLINESFLSNAADKDLYFLYITGLEKTLRNEDALRLAHYCSGAFEDDPRFPIILARIDEVYRAGIISMIGRGEGGGIPLPVVAEALYNCENLSERRLLTDYYLKSGGTDLRAKIEQVRFGPPTDPKILEGLVQDGLFHKDEQLVLLLTYLQTVEEIARLQGLFQKFSGTMDIRKDDGILSCRFRGGVPAEMNFNGKSGKERIVVTFLDGIPSVVTLMEGVGTVEFRYARYPFLLSVESLKGGEKKIFMMDQGVSMDVLQGIAEGFPVYRLVMENIFREDEDIAFRAQRVVILENDTRLSDYTKTFGDNAIIRESIRNMMDRTLVLRGGQPIEGVVDIDQDGIYETQLDYEDGKVIRMLYDGNGNGIPEYIYYPGDAEREEWDFNEDGRADLKEYTQESTRYISYYAEQNRRWITYTRDGKEWQMLE